MSEKSLPVSASDLAVAYFVEDVAGARTSGTRLQGVLTTLEAGRPLSRFQAEFLAARGLRALQRLAVGELDRASYPRTAHAEQRDRRALLKEQEAAQEKADAARAAEMDVRIAAAFAARENDPVLRRRREDRALRKRYGIDFFIEREDFRRVMRLLHTLEAEKQLLMDDVVWLETEREEYWTDAVRTKHHRLQAEALTARWRETGDSWLAVTASGHWRKAGLPEGALQVTGEVSGKGSKLRSAICTTRGGAMRDLRRFAEALALAEEAHALAPGDYRPCTLLGAIHVQIGAFALGTSWYDKAEALGASRKSIDQELRSLWSSAAPDDRMGLAQFLLGKDDERFSWAGRAARN